MRSFFLAFAITDVCCDDEIDRVRRCVLSNLKTSDHVCQRQHDVPFGFESISVKLLCNFMISKCLFRCVFLVKIITKFSIYCHEKFVTKSSTNSCFNLSRFSLALVFCHNFVPICHLPENYLIAYLCIFWHY